MSQNFFETSHFWACGRYILNLTLMFTWWWQMSTALGAPPLTPEAIWKWGAHFWVLHAGNIFWYPIHFPKSAPTFLQHSPFSWSFSQFLHLTYVLQHEVQMRGWMWKGCTLGQLLFPRLLSWRGTLCAGDWVWKVMCALLVGSGAKPQPLFDFWSR